MPINKPRFENRERSSQSGPRVNHRIRVPQVRVVGADGSMLGVLDTHEAQRMAREAGLDLVEVNPKAYPPVCKIMDFGKFKYEEKKKANEAKKKQVIVHIKEVKLRPKTEDHDYDFKVRNIKRFLEEGNKAKVTIMFRGREITHRDRGARLLEDVVKDTKDVAVVESPPRMEGKQMYMLLAPNPKILQRVRDQARQAATAHDKRDQKPAPQAGGQPQAAQPSAPAGSSAPAQTQPAAAPAPSQAEAK